MQASNFLLGVPGLLKKLYNQQSSGVKSVQQGVANYAGNPTVVVGITAVNLSKSILLVNPYGITVGGTNGFFAAGRFDSASQLTLTKNTDVQTAFWQVIEFY